MRVKNGFTQTPRFEQREAQQHLVAHTRPDRFCRKEIGTPASAPKGKQIGALFKQRA